MKSSILPNTTDKPTLAGRAPVGSENKFNPAPLADAEFCRLPNPRRGRCPVSGLSRSALIDLGVTVPGLLVRLRKPGAVRGAVLMHLPTLRGYLRDMREAQLKQEGNAQ
ncbi:MAG: hypothetical protein ACOYMN_10300 [Roseimicrobium sp.]